MIIRGEYSIYLTTNLPEQIWTRFSALPALAVEAKDGFHHQDR
jgi:hypothetical protein